MKVVSEPGHADIYAFIKKPFKILRWLCKLESYYEQENRNKNGVWQIILKQTIANNHGRGKDFIGTSTVLRFMD
jgi:hypothetical protein